VATKKKDISNQRAETKRMTDAKKRRQTTGQNVDAATRKPQNRAKQNQRLASMAQAGKSGKRQRRNVKAVTVVAKERAKYAKYTPGNDPHLAGSNITTEAYHKSPFTGGQQVEEARQAKGRRSGFGGRSMLPQLTQVEHLATKRGYRGNPVSQETRDAARQRLNNYRNQNVSFPGNSRYGYADTPEGKKETLDRAYRRGRKRIEARRNDASEKVRMQSRVKMNKKTAPAVKTKKNGRK